MINAGVLLYIGELFTNLWHNKSMNRLFSTLKRAWARVSAFSAPNWRRFRKLPMWAQIVSGIVLVVALGGLVALARGGASANDSNAARTVTVQSVASLNGTSDGVEVLGSVRSVAEADILAQSSGTVTAVHGKVGQSVPAGYIIASLDNAAQAAAVLQAQGAYEGALAARNATALQSGNAAGSFTEAQTSARNTYRSTYTSLDSALQNQVDTLFGGATPIGPQLLISDPATGTQLERQRYAIAQTMDIWRDSLATSDSAGPEALLSSAQSTVQTVSTFLTTLAHAANTSGSGATATQLSNLATARATVDGLLASISAARDTYRAKKTAAEVAQTQSDSTNTDVASADATVKQALGSLRAAQAAYEKTVIRAPIAGTLNFMSLHVGDYATAMTHVATVARNNALEVVAYLSDADRDRVAVGDTVMVEGKYKAVVTSVAPALDPTTKQTEVDMAIAGDAGDLVDGESVHIGLPTPTATPSKTAASPNTATTTASANTTILLPLAAVKLRTTDRVVFTVATDGALVAHKVEIGDVIGDRIAILSGVTPDLKIVTDARGLSEGEKVTVATSTAQ